MKKNPFLFTVQKTTKGRARTGILETPHGSIQTPVFMPVGTVGAVKTMTPDELKEAGAEIILTNTYHLFLRPGEKIIQKMEGLHKWICWDRPILTDSGGFQIFSLGKMTKVRDEGVEFQSHLDGSKHFLTPEKAIKIQHDLGSDIIMVLDECASAHVGKIYAREAMKRTHEWAIRCKKEHEILEERRSQKQNSQKLPQALFPIIQGVTYKDLRIESAKFIVDLNLPGIAIGGLSVGESKEKMITTLEAIHPFLPENKPRYLMGVGSPEDLLEAIDRGIDMFDCVLPTRLARHGAFWTKNGRHQIKNAAFKRDEKPLMQNCRCYGCRHFSSSYIRHLYLENEILAHRLLTVHNLTFLLDFMAEIRKKIEGGTFQNFKKKFLTRFACK